MKFIFIIATLFYSSFICGQLPQNRIFSDSSNKYLEDYEVLTLPTEVDIDTLTTNPIKFSRNIFEVQKLYRSQKLKVAIFVNEMWKKKESSINDMSEFYFKCKADGTKAHFFTSSDTLTTLQQIVNDALLITRRIYFDAEIVKAEYRYVNANKILFVELAVKIKRYNFRILHYFYKGKDGETQISLSVLKNDLRRDRNFYESFLNGFVITENEKK